MVVDNSNKNCLFVFCICVSHHANRYFNTTLYDWVGPASTSTLKTTKHVFLGDLLVASIESATSTGTTTTFIHTDHLGGLSVSTDINGDQAERADYYPYGGLRIDVGSVRGQRKYAGIEFDPDTTYSYAQARYLDTGRGQFVSQDPLARNNPERLLSDPHKFNSYSYARNNPIAFLDTNGLSEAYFGSRSALGFGPWQHTYQAYSIDLQAEANQLRIGVPVPSNMSADNPFNFTLGFGPIDGSLQGGIGYSGGLGDNAWLRDYANANLNGFTSSGYNLSPGSYGNYAQLANASYNVAQAINAGGVPYGPFGSVSVWDVIALRNYYNSNSAISTVSNLTGQSSSYNQFVSSINNKAPGSGNTSISVTTVGSGSVAQSTPSYLIGNQIGAFVGTYNFGSGIGTYNFGTQSWE